MTISTEPTSAATDFLDALAQGDFAGLAACLTDGVRFRALLPPGPLELEGSSAVIDRFRSWFGQDETFELLDSDLDHVGTKVRLRLRVQVCTPGQHTRLAEQTVFATVGERIETMDLLCSGWQVVDD